MNKKLVFYLEVGILTVGIGTLSVIGYNHTMKRDHILAGTLIEKALTVNLDGGHAFVREVNSFCSGTHYLDVMSGKEYHQITDDCPDCQTSKPERTITGGYPAYYDFTTEELSDGKITPEEVISAVKRGK